MNTVALRACLFGGALFASGLASADEFIVATNTDSGGTNAPYASVTTLVPYNIDFSYGPGFGFGTFDAYDAGTSASAVLSASEITVSNFKPAGAMSTAAAGTLTVFGVTATSDVTISWDVDTDMQIRDILVQRDTSPAAVLFNYSSLPAGQQASGSTTLTLEAGISYTVRIRVASFNTQGDGMLSLTLPPPPPECYADCDGDGDLDVDDIDCFVASFLSECT